jgi:hypothetical protein
VVSFDGVYFFTKKSSNSAVVSGLATGLPPAKLLCTAAQFHAGVYFLRAPLLKIMERKNVVSNLL